MQKQKFSEVVKRIWKIASPYWTQSDEKWGSLLLLCVNVAVMVLTTFMGLRFVIWNRDWLNAFNNRDAQMWAQNIWIFLLLGWSMIFTGTFNGYVTQWVNVRWKRWMTARYMKLWMENHTHYRMQLSGNQTDNPDQRIAEDVANFINGTWLFSFSFVQNLLSLFTYVTVLYGYSLTIPMILGGIDFSFPGYLIVLSILWAVITTAVTHKVGKPLSRLSYNQQMYDANFRFSLVRFRENSEQIALLDGENVEHMRIMGIFGDAIVNTFRMMGRNMKVGLTTGMLQYVDAMMFTLLLGPAFFFYGAIDGYGTLQLIATAFMNVVNGFKWFQTNYVMLAPYVAQVDRLYAFNINYEKTVDIIENSEIRLNKKPMEEIVVHELDVNLPYGKLQISAKDMTLRHGEKILIKGRTGAGKTTLFRVISGIWPYGKGNIDLPADKKVMVLPQSPYFPIGTLAEAVSYPFPADTYTREAMEQALLDVGLPAFSGRLDEVGHWNMMLSGGEQQRVGIARAMLYNPDYLFFDEATASMDEPSEEVLYGMLLERMKETTIISIGHRTSLEKFHGRLIVAEGEPGGPYNFVERPASALAD